MRLPLLSLLLLCTTATNAQLINGSFENGTTGWNVPCECAPATFSSDGAPGGGTQCIGLENVHLDCGCMLASAVDQPTPWLTPGMWHFSGWIKSAVAGDMPGSRIAFGAGPFSSPTVDLWSYAGIWEYKEAQFTLTGTEDFAGLRVSLVPDDGNQQPPALCYFDHIQLTSTLTTGIAVPSRKEPAFRPNPATDQLWVDLAGAPLGIQLMDAAGRTVEVVDFAHQEHTARINVSHATPGLNTLIIRTASGTRTLRFIKA